MRILSTILFIIIGFTSFSQTETGKIDLPKKKKGTAYFLWGYNRDWFTKSTIHFKNDGDPNLQNEKGVYDFTLYNVTASDRPQFDRIKDVANITIPQFNFRLGYYFNDKHDQGIELNYDHSKYVVNDWQTVRIKGSAFGNSFDKDTVLNPNYIHFEHTDGANFWLINYMKRFKIYESKNLKNNIGLIVKPGIGIVYPRTDVTLFGNRVNNKWHISGIDVGLEAGIRMELFKHLTIELTGKGVYADYFAIIVQRQGNGQAKQKMLAFEAILNVGYSLNW
jgi:hypothetical protein